MEFVAYYRVSTNRQGKSGLGLEAQKESVRLYLKNQSGTLNSEFIEIESGKKDDRPKLKTAIAECRRRKATLIIAKLDRLARNVHFISGLMESKIDFIAVDNPHANRLMIHLLAAFAEHEREQISQRTKAALAAAKERGVLLGKNGFVLAESNRKEAGIFAAHLRATIVKLQQSGITSYRGIAEALNGMGVHSRNGANWHPMMVSRVLKRLESA